MKDVSIIKDKQAVGFVYRAAKKSNRNSRLQIQMCVLPAFYLRKWRFSFDRQVWFSEKKT